MLASLRSLSWRYVSGSGVTRLSRTLAPTLDDVVLGLPVEEQAPVTGLRHGGQRRAAGDRILHLYFRQWRVPEGLFLDLRPGRFSYGKGVLCFTPNGLWTRVRPGFREGMIALYASFYGADEAAFDAALRQMGMLRPGLAAAEEARLKALLEAHFGLDQQAQRFSIDTFKASFDALFEFFLAHGYTLHSDFVLVGFNLITLYLALERLGQAHDVRAICADALELAG